MADRDVFITLHGVGQWLPIAPCGAVIIYDRGTEYGTSYELNLLTGEISYTPGSIDEFRFIIASTNVYGGGDAPVTKQNYAVWGPHEDFPVITLKEGIGQGLRNSSFLTKSPFTFLSQYKDYTYNSYITCWKALDEFNKNWTAWDDWFIPSREELLALINATLDANHGGTGETFGFLKWGWVEGSSEYSGNTNNATNALITDGSEGSGADKLSASYGRLYFRYLGGTGYEGLASASFPTGVTGSIPIGYESLNFRRLKNQVEGDTFTWGGTYTGNIYLAQQVQGLTGGTGLTIGEGVKLSLFLAMGCSISLPQSSIESTTAMGENLSLFINRESIQANTFGNLPLNKVGIRDSTLEGAELLPFIPSRDELISILNEARGKGIFTEGEEFWSVSDASATTAYSVTYHESSEPTTATKDKTTALKCLICKWKQAGDLPRIPDLQITVEDVALYSINISVPTGNGTVIASPSQETEAGNTVTITCSPNPSYKVNTVSVTDGNSSSVSVTTVTEGSVYSFIMPSSNVTISVSFSAIENPIIYLTLDGFSNDPRFLNDVSAPYYLLRIGDGTIKAYDSSMQKVDLPYQGNFFSEDTGTCGDEYYTQSMVYFNGQYYLSSGSNDDNNNTIERWNPSTGEVTVVYTFPSFFGGIGYVLIRANSIILAIPHSFLNGETTLPIYYSTNMTSWTTLFTGKREAVNDYFYKWVISNDDVAPLLLGNWVAIYVEKETATDTTTNDDGTTSLVFSTEDGVLFFNISTYEYTYWNSGTSGFPNSWAVVDGRFYLFENYVGTSPTDLVQDTNYYYYVRGNTGKQILVKEKNTDLYFSSYNMNNYTPISYENAHTSIRHYQYWDSAKRLLGTAEGYDEFGGVIVASPLSPDPYYAVFEDDPNTTNGTYTISKTGGLHQGDTVTVSVSPNTGYVLGSISVRRCSDNTAVSYSSSSSGISFTMPPSDVQLSVAFTEDTSCLDADALVTLADGTYKKFRDLDINDRIMVWDFDEGRIDFASLLWKTEARRIKGYYLLKTENKEIKVIKNHRFFCPELGRFERATDLVGKQIWTDTGTERVISCNRVEEEVDYCNAISYYHLNVIVNGFLTSCGFNNIYPIKDMRFQTEEKRNRGTSLSYWQEKGIPQKWYDGMRLNEQYSPDEEIIDYINFKRKEAGEVNV